MLQEFPEKVAKVLHDLHANYDAINGSDYNAAINAYSPIYITNWNQESSYFTWEEIVNHSTTYPTDRRDLLEAKVLDLNDHTAVVYVRVLYSELPQTFGGLYEPNDPREPYEYEEVLYLDYTENERWTFNVVDYLD